MIGRKVFYFADGRVMVYTPETGIIPCPFSSPMPAPDSPEMN